MADFNIVTLLVLLQWNLRLGGRAHCDILHRLQYCRLRWIQVHILGVAPHGRFPMVCPCIHIEELCSTLLGELFIALFLLLCATYFLFVVSHCFLCFSFLPFPKSNCGLQHLCPSRECSMAPTSPFQHQWHYFRQGYSIENVYEIMTHYR